MLPGVPTELIEVDLTLRGEMDNDLTGTKPFILALLETEGRLENIFVQ